MSPPWRWSQVGSRLQLSFAIFPWIYSLRAPPSQVPGDEPQPPEAQGANPVLLPWVTTLQRGVAELRGVLADLDAKRWQLEVRLPEKANPDLTHITRHSHYPFGFIWQEYRAVACWLLLTPCGSTPSITCRLRPNT